MYAASVSSAAKDTLQQGLEGQPPGSPSSTDGADAATAGAGGWKGWQGQIGDLLQLWLAWSPEPCQAMLGLLQGPLSQVPAFSLTGKKAQEPVAGFPGSNPTVLPFPELVLVVQKELLPGCTNTS